MFGIGVLELSVIFVVALLIFGPKRLPDLARTVGKGLAEFRRASADLRHSLDLSIDDSPPRTSTRPDVPPFDPRQQREQTDLPAQAVGSIAPSAAPGAATSSDPQATLPGIGDSGDAEGDDKGDDKSNNKGPWPSDSREKHAAAQADPDPDTRGD